MASYVITKAGRGLKVVGDNGDIRFFDRPSVRGNTGTTWPATASNAIELYDHANRLVMGLAEIATIDGVATAGTITLAIDQLAALITAPAVPAAVGITSVQTSASGNVYTAFASQACKQVTILNNTGTSISVQRGSSGLGLVLVAGASYTFAGLTNASGLRVKRTDDSTTQVTVFAEYQS